MSELGKLFPKKSDQKTKKQKMNVIIQQARTKNH